MLKMLSCEPKYGLTYLLVGLQESENKSIMSVPVEREHEHAEGGSYSWPS